MKQFSPEQISRVRMAISIAKKRPLTARENAAWRSMDCGRTPLHIEKQIVELWERGASLRYIAETLKVDKSAALRVKRIHSVRGPRCECGLDRHHESLCMQTDPLKAGHQPAKRVTYKRICIEDWWTEDRNGQRLELKRGTEYITSKMHDDGTITVMAGYWVRTPAAIWAGSKLFTGVE